MTKLTKAEILTKTNDAILVASHSVETVIERVNNEFRDRYMKIKVPKHSAAKTIQEETLVCQVFIFLEIYLFLYRQMRHLKIAVQPTTPRGWNPKSQSKNQLHPIQHSTTLKECELKPLLGKKSKFKLRQVDQNHLNHRINEARPVPQQSWAFSKQSLLIPQVKKVCLHRKRKDLSRYRSICQKKLIILRKTN